jgi:hypothetical protein
MPMKKGFNMVDNPLIVVTPKARASFAKVFEPEAFKEGDDPQYSLSLLFPKDTNLKPLKAAVRAAAEKKWGSKLPKKLALPFKDGDEYEYDGYADMVVVRASTKYAPKVVQRNPRIDCTEEDFYSGCWCRAGLQAFAYDYQGMKKGVSFALIHVQKLEDDEPFSGRQKAEDMFNDDMSEKDEAEQMFGDDTGF